MAKMRKQAEAFAAQLPGQITVACDVSASGHKTYGCLTPDEVDLLGPGYHNEVIRTTSVCKLYFDLEHPRQPGDMDDDEELGGWRILYISPRAPSDTG